MGEHNLDIKIRIIRGAEPSPDGCWIWQGAKLKEGYGVIGVRGKLQLTHRIAYKEFVGPIPVGYHIDHLCRVTSCCNPTHLEPVTPKENYRRAMAAKNS